MNASVFYPPASVILVSGPPRCGTSMLAGVLSGGAAHPLLPECQIITDLIRERFRSERETGAGKFSVFLQNSNFADEIYREAIDRILLEILAGSKSNSKFIVLKDPSLLFYVNVVNRFFSWPTKQICIIRDPRDSIASYMSVRMREGVRPGIGEAIDFVAPYYHAILESQQETRELFIVRYEDLVTKDPHVESQIVDHVGYKVDFRGYGGLSQDELDLSDPWCTPLYGSPISETSIKSYENVISPDEFYLLNDVFKKFIDFYY